VKIEREQAEGRNAFTGYGKGYVEVNARRHEESVVVGAGRLIEWRPQSIEAVTSSDVEIIAALKPEIVLVGSGPAFRFPDPAALAPLYAARIGVEVMDTQAACRTYNILIAEGRDVVAALIV
jgi:uncharacterized protein